MAGQLDVEAGVSSCNGSPKGARAVVDAHEHTAVHMHYARPLGHHRCPAAVWLQHPPPPGIRPGTQAGRPILSSASRSCESSGAAQFHSARSSRKYSGFALRVTRAIGPVAVAAPRCPTQPSAICAAETLYLGGGRGSVSVVSAAKIHVHAQSSGFVLAPEGGAQGRERRAAIEHLAVLEGRVLPPQEFSLRSKVAGNLQSLIRTAISVMLWRFQNPGVSSG